MDDFSINEGNSIETEDVLLSKAEALALMDHAKFWTLTEDGKSLAREYIFPNFKEALDFVNVIGNISEEENHHPDITLSWGKVGVTLTTHSAGGLTKKDFIVAKNLYSTEIQG
jgi:4a-hydroxytetrahydrobiopterin dehydratase